MTIITETFLKDLGINLSGEEAALLSEHFETTLHDRVFHEIVGMLDQPQAEALLAMTERDDPGISDWLIANVPELSEIVQDEIDILLGELIENGDKL